MICSNDAGQADQGSLTCGQQVAADTTSGEQGGGQVSREHNYTFTITEVTNITWSTCDSSYDTWLVITASDGTQWANCDDCGPCGTKAVVSIPGTYSWLGLGFVSTNPPAFPPGAMPPHTHTSHDMLFCQSVRLFY